MRASAITSSATTSATTAAPSVVWSRYRVGLQLGAVASLPNGALWRPQGTVLNSSIVSLGFEPRSSASDMSRFNHFMKRRPEAIKRWRASKTTVVITHNLSQIKPSDIVCVLKGGQVV